MKIKALINCTGIGYEDFKKGEEREIEDKIAEVLINFAYAEKVNSRAKKSED